MMTKKNWSQSAAWMRIKMNINVGKEIAIIWVKIVYKLNKTNVHKIYDLLFVCLKIIVFLKYVEKGRDMS